MASATLLIMPPEAALPEAVTLPAPPRNLSLYELEANLSALLDTAAMVDPEDELQFSVDLETSVAASVDKRDRVNGFLVHCESLAASAGAEIKRLQERKSFFERVVGRVEFTVLRTIRNLGADAKGKYKSLAGSTVTFSARRCPATVAIVDEAVVPALFKSISITLPALTWEAVLDALDMETRAKVLDEVKRPESTVNKALVKAAIEAAAPAGWEKALKEEGALPVRVEDVQGAAIVAGELKLVRK